MHHKEEIQFLGARMIHLLDAPDAEIDLPRMGPYADYRRGADKYAVTKRVYYLRKKLAAGSSEGQMVMWQRELEKLR